MTFFFQWLSQIVQLLNAFSVPTRRLGIKDIMRTDNPVEETDVETGDYNPLE